MNWRFCPEPRGNVRPTSAQLGQMIKNPPKIRSKEIICEIDTILLMPAYSLTNFQYELAHTLIGNENKDKNP